MFWFKLYSTAFHREYCEVHPLSDQYITMRNIPIAPALTAWADNPDTREVILLLFHQDLWFGNTLTNSLNDPNQSRMHGIEICNNPFDRHQRLGVKDPVNDIEIPTEFGNSFVFLKTQSPTMEEIRTVPPINWTSYKPLWDPSKVSQRQNSGGKRRNNRGSSECHN
jgi:hypothetical protein